MFNRKYILQMVDFPIVMSGFFLGKKNNSFLTSEKKTGPSHSTGASTFKKATQYNNTLEYFQ